MVNPALHNMQQKLAMALTTDLLSGVSIRATAYH